LAIFFDGLGLKLVEKRRVGGPATFEGGGLPKIEEKEEPKRR
jgi:hypothetical protein